MREIIGEQIKMLMSICEITQTELSLRTNISQPMISKIISGERKGDPSTINKIAEALGTTRARLIEQSQALTSSLPEVSCEGLPDKSHKRSKLSTTEALRGKHQEKNRMSIAEREECRLRLEKVVRIVGEHILSFSGTVRDISDAIEHGHESSTLDESARKFMAMALEGEFTDRNMTLQFELHPLDVRTKVASSKRKLHFLIDEIDGTTNVKRWASAPRSYLPQSAVCIAVCTSTSLESLEVGVVFTLDQKETYSGIRLSRDFSSFAAFLNGEPLVAYPIKQGDSKNRLLVIGYTSKVRIRKAKIEKALLALGGCSIYDGCRSSTMDIINIIRNQYDAYIDVRAVFGEESETRLEAYDVAGILPSAYAGSLKISDIYGRSLTEYNWEDPLPLLVARPEIYEEIIDVLQDLSKQGDVIPCLEEWLSMLESHRSKRKRKPAQILIESNKLKPRKKTRKIISK